MNKDIIITNACANNLKNVDAVIKFGQLTICAGPSGSGKSSFAFDSLVKKEKCIIENYPLNVKSISQRVSDTSDKIKELLKLKDTENSLIVIDEPLAGTTYDEAKKYSMFIKKLSKKNAVVVVEHRKEIFEQADTVLLFGPNSGTNGGYILEKTNGKKYLESLVVPSIERTENKSNKKISASYSIYNGVKDYNVSIYLNTITTVTGPIKSGKTTYLNAIYDAFDKSVGSSERRRNLLLVKGKNYIRRPHIIDASPVSKNSKSTVSTYYNLTKYLKGENLDITVKEAINIYKDNNLIIRRLKYLEELGLDYLKLNQNSFTLSGGECQRIKLAKLLCKKLGDRSIYIFDNPVRGLGEKNINQIMMMFDKLVKNNNTVLIAENDPTAIKFVDKVINI